MTKIFSNLLICILFAVKTFILEQAKIRACKQSVQKSYHLRKSFQLLVILRVTSPLCPGSHAVLPVKLQNVMFLYHLVVIV